MSRPIPSHLSSYHTVVMFCALLLFQFVKSQAIQDTLTFEHIKTGMSQSSVSEIHEDKEGYLWIGTPSGLNRYNGKDFEVFSKSLDGVTGLTNGYITSIFEDLDSNIYIGTIQGLNIYDRKLNLVKPYPFKEMNNEIQSKTINTVQRTGDYLWVGTLNSGLYRYNRASGETKLVSLDLSEERSLQNKKIINILKLSTEELLVVTQGNSYLIGHDLKIKKEFFVKETIASALLIGNTEFLLGSRDGNIVRFSIPNDTIPNKNISLTPGNSLLAMEKDDNGNIWIGAENAGLVIYNSTNDEFKRVKSDYKNPKSISGNSIWSLCKAKNGVMWMGLFKNGINFYDPDYYKFTHIKNNPFNSSSLSNNIVNCFSEDKQGNIWIGMDGGGLDYWDREKNVFKNYSLNNNSLNSNVILCILPQKNDKLWLGSWGKGITIFDAKTKKYTVWNTTNSFLLSDYVMDLIQDRSGNIWIATIYGGLQMYNPMSGEHKTINLKTSKNKKADNVSSLYEDNNGSIWVGTATTGVFNIYKENNKWTYKGYSNLDATNFISNDYVNTITQDDYGNLWVGTQSGLNKYIKNEDKFLVISKLDGLKNDAIKGIVEDEYGYLWLSTENGIIRYNTKENTFANYDTHDGLQSNDFNAKSFFKTKDYELLFGGSNGLNIFTARQAKKRDDKLDIKISELKVFNKTVIPNDESGILSEDISQMEAITLDYTHSVFKINYSALTFKGSDKVSYAYFLEGFEDDWNYVDNTTSATYTNIDPGTYKFRIKSTNADGVWNNNEASLHITITPPFWKTTWFRISILGLFIGIAYLIYYLRIRNIKKYQEKLKRQIKIRTKDLRLQKKKLAATAKELSQKNEEIQRFTYAVSHDLKSPLNSIEVMANFISMELDEKSQPDTVEYLTYITKSCSIMKNLISDITNIAKLGKIENKNEVLESKEIIQTASNMAIGRFKEQKAELIIGDNLPTIYGDRMRLIQVFENLIDNAVKYMGNQEKPVVEISSKIKPHLHEFFITDNGSGMDATALEKLFTPFQRFHSKTDGTGLGLYMIKKIIDSHNGTITAESEGKGKGTTFIIQLPKKEAA